MADLRSSLALFNLKGGLLLLKFISIGVTFPCGHNNFFLHPAQICTACWQ